MALRILPVKDIPEALWLNNKLNVPEELKIAYAEHLGELGMLDKAIEGKPGKDGIYGGITDEETIKHYTYRFPASSGRVEFVTISPNDRMLQVSNAILSTFSQGEVSVLDIPGGTGAAMCSLLTTLAVLRHKGVLPILPLTVRIMCGDFSPKAIEIYREMISKIKPFVSKCGILVQFETMVWDATRNDHTAKLIDGWFAISKPQSEYMVCVSNFTGALGSAGMFEKFKPCLSQILARLHDKKSTLLWIEPGSNSTTRIFSKLIDFFLAAIEWFQRDSRGDESIKSSYTMVNPLNKAEHYSSVEVQRFNRT